MHYRDVTEYLQVLVGLQLSLARRAADMRIFHFGPLRDTDEGSVGTFALHLQCPWRLEGPRGVVTGRSDLWEPADPHTMVDWDTWDYDTSDNLQDVKLADLLKGYDAVSRAISNETDGLVVECVISDSYGGAIMALSGEYRLVVFPAGSRGEHWRLFQPDTAQPHLVSEDQAISFHGS